MWWIVLIACAPRGSGLETDPLLVPLAAADQLWDARATPDGLAHARSAYEALLVSPAEPRVLARIARVDHRVGLVAVERFAALAAYEASRETSERCLAEDPDVAPVLAAASWRWTADVLRRVGPRRASCLTWALAAAVGTVEVRGPGAALELERAQPLAARALALSPDDPWVMRSAAELVLLDPRSDGPARDAAVALLRRAAAAQPGFLLFEADIARAMGTSYTPPPPVENDPYALENRWLRDHLQSGAN